MFDCNFRKGMSQRLGFDREELRRELDAGLLLLRDKVFEHFGSKLKVTFLGIGAMPQNLQDAHDVDAEDVLVAERLREHRVFSEKVSLIFEQWRIDGFQYHFIDVFEGVNGSARGEVVNVFQMHRCAESLSSIVGVPQ